MAVNREWAPLTVEEEVKKYLPLMADACVVREMCASEIITRLKRREVSCEAQRIIVERLVEGRFIDEKRYAGAYVRDKFRFNGWGRWKILQGLKAKGVDNNIAEQAVASIPADESREKLLELAKKKSRGLDTSNQAHRMRIYRFLASRGFEGSDITWALRQINMQCDDE